MKKINLIYYKDKSINGNFGDELSKFITEKLINKNKYKLVFNQSNEIINILCIGSYIHCAKNNSFIFGSGVRTPNNIEKAFVSIFFISCILIASFNNFWV